MVLASADHCAALELRDPILISEELGSRVAAVVLLGALGNDRVHDRDRFHSALIGEQLDQFGLRAEDQRLAVVDSWR